LIVSCRPTTALTGASPQALVQPEPEAAIVRASDVIAFPRGHGDRPLDLTPAVRHQQHV
jgi:hypothetical protein